MWIGTASVSSGMGGIAMQVMHHSKLRQRRLKYFFHVDKNLTGKLIFRLDVQLIKLWDSSSFQSSIVNNITVSYSSCGCINNAVKTHTGFACVAGGTKTL